MNFTSVCSDGSGVSVINGNIVVNSRVVGRIPTGGRGGMSMTSGSGGMTINGRPLSAYYFATSGGAAPVETVHTEEFAIPAECTSVRIVDKIGTSKIKISSVDDATAGKITVKKTVWAAGDETQAHVSAKRGDGGGWLLEISGDTFNGTVEVYGCVFADAEILAMSSSGDVVVAGPFRHVDASVSNGTAVCRGCSSVSARCSNGSVRLEDSVGLVGSVRSSNGSVRVTGGWLKELDAETSNGSVKIDSACLADTYAHVESVNGSARVDNPGGTKTSGFGNRRSSTKGIFARASNGNVRVALAIHTFE